MVAVTVVDPKCGIQGYTIYKCDLDESCTETENDNFTDALEHVMVLDTEKLTNGAPSCLTNGNWPYYCERGCGEVAYNLNDEENSGAVHGGYTEGEWVTAPTCITPATYYCTFCETNFSADIYPEIEGQATGVHTYEELIEESVASCTAYGYKVMGCTNDANCEATDVIDWADKLDHNFVVGENYSIVCDCGATYQNIAAMVKEYRLCGESCTGCEIHDMKIIVVAATEDDEIEVEGGSSTEAPTEKNITIIGLNGADDTVYTITLKDSEGNTIDSFEIEVAGETNEFGVTTSVTGNAYVDISEVADQVASIVIETTANATVSFFSAK